MSNDIPVCPACGTMVVVPIVYGLPGLKTLDLAYQGGMALGGCCVFGECPIWHCQKCGHRWELIDLDAPPIVYSDAIMAAFKSLQPLSENERRIRISVLALDQFLAQVPLEASLEDASSIVLRKQAGEYRLFFEIAGTEVLMKSTGLEEMVVFALLANATSAKTEHVFFDAEIAGVRHSFPIQVTNVGSDPIIVIKTAGISSHLSQGTWKRPRMKLCPCCSHALRTPLAKQCFSCGANWHDPKDILHREN